MQIQIGQDMEPRQQAIVDEFQAVGDWEARYQKLIELGSGLAAMPEELRTDTFKLKGCQSQVWLHAKLENGKVLLSADSDALIVKGLVALVLRVYNERPPAEILAQDAVFVDAIGMRTHLSPTRANGLAAMLKQIRMYAMAFQVQQGAV